MSIQTPVYTIIFILFTDNTWPVATLAVPSGEPRIKPGTTTLLHSLAEPKTPHHPQSSADNHRIFSQLISFKTQCKLYVHMHANAFMLTTTTAANTVGEDDDVH